MRICAWPQDAGDRRGEGLLKRRREDELRSGSGSGMRYDDRRPGMHDGRADSDRLRRERFGARKARPPLPQLAQSLAQRGTALSSPRWRCAALALSADGWGMRICDNARHVLTDLFVRRCDLLSCCDGKFRYFLLCCNNIARFCDMRHWRGADGGRSGLRDAMKSPNRRSSSAGRQHV